MPKQDLVGICLSTVCWGTQHWWLPLLYGSTQLEVSYLSFWLNMAFSGRVQLQRSSLLLSPVLLQEQLCFWVVLVSQVRTGIWVEYWAWLTQQTHWLSAGLQPHWPGVSLNVPSTWLSGRMQSQVCVVTGFLLTITVLLVQAQLSAIVFEFEVQVKALLMQQVQRLWLVLPLKYCKHVHWLGSRF